MNQIRGRTAAQDLNEVAEVSGGALHVANTGIAGSITTAFMHAVSDAAAPDPANATDVANSTTGWKSITVTPITDVADGQCIIIGWSTTSGDTDVEANLNTAAGSHASPDGVGYPNQLPISERIPSLTVNWDGTTKIKRFAMTNTAAADLIVAVTFVA